MNIFRFFYISPLALVAPSAIAAGDGGLLTNPTFWMAISFLLFIIMAIKPIMKAALSVLDARVKEIENRLKEASRLKEEALEMRAQAERTQHEAHEEAQRLIDYAQKDAQLIRTQGQENLEKTIAKKQAALEQRIKMMETRALSALRAQTAEISAKALEQLIDDNFSDADDDALIEETIQKLPELMQQNQN